MSRFRQCFLLAALCGALGCSNDSSGDTRDGSAGGARGSGGGPSTSGGGGGGSPLDGGAPASDGSAAAIDGGANSTAVALRFKAMVGERAFECGATYSGVGTSQVDVTPLDLRFYVEEVWLTSGKNRTRVVLDERTPWQTRDIALVDFEDSAGQCGNGNSQTNVQITGSVPQGDYDGLVFTVGVPEFLNHLPDDQFPPPLQPIYMLWSWLAGFKFFVAEVLQVPGPAGAVDGGAFEAGVPGAGLLHVGSTACYAGDAGDKRCNHSNRITVQLSSFDIGADSVVVDLAEVFGAVDLRAEQSCHSSGASCPKLFESVGLDFATGAESGEQRVFRAE